MVNVICQKKKDLIAEYKYSIIDKMKIKQEMFYADTRITSIIYLLVFT